jgi:hypothetical protein
MSPNKIGGSSSPLILTRSAGTWRRVPGHPPLRAGAPPPRARFCCAGPSAGRPTGGRHPTGCMRRTLSRTWRRSAPQARPGCTTAQPGRLTGAAHQQAFAGLASAALHADPPARRTPVSERAPRSAPGSGPSGMARPLAHAATATSRDDPSRGSASDQGAKSHGNGEAGFAQVTCWQRWFSAWNPLSCQQRQPREHTRLEYTYGGPSGRRCCTLLLYLLFDLFEFRF